jgi:tRNA pseudouridine(38-40) synthase
MPRYKLTIEYDGRPFVGWQVQDNGPSVQGVLAVAIAAFCGEEARVQGAGRTDAGVHARGQVGHVDLAKDWEEDTVRDAVNAHLRPHPVAVLKAERVADTFDARFSAIRRHYRYRIVSRRADLTFERGLAWRIAKPLDNIAMHAAAQRLVGRHDFTTFRHAECQAKSPVKTLDRLDVERSADEIEVMASARSRSWGRASGRPTTSPLRLRSATAPPAPRSRRRTGSISRGWITSSRRSGASWRDDAMQGGSIVPRLLLSVLASALFALAPAGYAQNFPAGPVRIIVPFPAGGATDVLGRVLSVHLQNLWGSPVVTEYRPGAAGLIGTRQVAAAPADGHTLLMASTGAILALAAERTGSGAYDIARELAPISLVAAPPYILVVNPALPVKTAAELIAHAKQNPGKISFGSSGVGSASHLSGALFQQMAGIDMLHVPYRGTGPAVTDLLGGRIELMFSPALTVTPHVAAGTLRVIGTTGSARSALFPDFPTVAESGLPGYSSLGWFGLFAPAGTPRDLVARISADAKTVLTLPEAKQRLAEQGAEPEPSTPDAFAAFVNSDIAKWLALAQKTGIKLTP